tara:strand:+ start:309 stop:416 length:108 start_codon:yes stop_codon:yes gene_type:complete
MIFFVERRSAKIKKKKKEMSQVVIFVLTQPYICNP